MPGLLSGDTNNLSGISVILITWFSFWFIYASFNRILSSTPMTAQQYPHYQKEDLIQNLGPMNSYHDTLQLRNL